MLSERIKFHLGFPCIISGDKVFVISIDYNIDYNIVYLREKTNEITQMNEIIIILLLIVLNGVFSMSEIAIISARKTTLSNKAKRGDKGAGIALRLVDNPDRFLSTVQIGITLIGILTGIYSGAALSDKFAVALSAVGFPPSTAHWIAQTIIVVAVTYLSIVAGELVPKRIGMNAAGSVSVIMARPMLWLSRLAAPFVWLLSKSSETVIGLLGFGGSRSKVTEADIKSIVQEGKNDGEVQEVEQDIVERVFLMGDLIVSQLMTHRSDVSVLEDAMSADEVKAAIAGSTHMAYPVVDSSNDKIVGAVYLKDIALTISDRGFCVRDIVRPAKFFYENMTVYLALEQMKRDKISQAFVCDEFGDFRGIITLRDILEGLVGSIAEQNSDPDIVSRADGAGWLVDGQCSFHEFLTYINREDLFDEVRRYNTVAGMIIEQLEHIPSAGESVCWNGLRFEIVDMDNARIDKVLVT